MFFECKKRKCTPISRKGAWEQVACLQLFLLLVDDVGAISQDLGSRACPKAEQSTSVHCHLCQAENHRNTGVPYQSAK
jgi:hypothetical protein